MKTYNNQSIYAINKAETNKIIFETLDENEKIYIELKDGVVTEHYVNTKYSESNYSKISKDITAENFEEYKFEHNENLRILDNEQSRDRKWTCSINELENSTKLSVGSALDVLTKPYDDLENISKAKKRREKGLEIFDKLTETQKRRYKLHIINKYSIRKIADLEGVNRNAIWKSIKQIEEKIKKLL